MANDAADITYKWLKKAEYNTLMFGFEQALALSSGPFSLSQIRKLGHGYSRADPHPPLNPAIINEQTGEFKAGWRIEMFYGGPELGVSGGLVNESVHADLIEGAGSGASRMIRRPISQVLEKRMEVVREANLENAIFQAIKEIYEQNY